MQGNSSVARLWGRTTDDALDVELYDQVVLAELQLTADLMIIANTTQHHLTQHAIDVVLGLDAVLPLPRSTDGELEAAVGGEDIAVSARGRG